MEMKNLFSGIIEQLPNSVILEIILKLPIKSIIICKCVCKSWYMLISDPLFAKNYAKNSPFTALVRSDHRYQDCDDVSFYFVEIGENGDVMHTHFNPVAPDLHEAGDTSIIGSCNGLLCMEKRGKVYRYGDYADKLYRGSYKNLDVYVINPLWGDYMVLPVVGEPVEIFHVVYGFGVSPSTNEYKVLRLVTRYVSIMNSDELEVYGEIFTIGDDYKWRYFKSSSIPYRLNPEVITLNGAFHWISSHMDFGVLFAFDIGKEKGRCMSLPHGLITPLSHPVLAEWNGHLCFCDTKFGFMIPPGELSADVWVMKQYGVVESWTKDIILTSSIPKDLHSDSLIPIAKLRNGDLLMSDMCGRSLLSFDPKTNWCSTFEIVLIDGTTTFLFEYVPNFFSLKDALKIGDKFVVDV